MLEQEMRQTTSESAVQFHDDRFAKATSHLRFPLHYCGTGDRLIKFVTIKSVRTDWQVGQSAFHNTPVLEGTFACHVSQGAHQMKGLMAVGSDLRSSAPVSTQGHSLLSKLTQHNDHDLPPSGTLDITVSSKGATRTGELMGWAHLTLRYLDVDL